MERAYVTRCYRSCLTNCLPQQRQALTLAEADMFAYVDPALCRLIMIFITNNVNCAMKTAESCNIPRAQLDDAKQTRPLSALREGCGYARLPKTHAAMSQGPAAVTQLNWQKMASFSVYREELRDGSVETWSRKETIA